MHLNDRISEELETLDAEAAQLRKKRAGWDDQSHFRFACIKRELQGAGREMLADRLALEFPHLSREQIEAHEAHCDALKYLTQRRNALWRQWRKDRLALLRQHQARLEERLRDDETQACRRRELEEQRE